MKIVIDIDHCGQCPKSKKNDHGQGVYSIDCTLLGYRTVPYVEHPSELREPPDNCPLRANTINIIEESLND